MRRSITSLAAIAAKPQLPSLFVVRSPLNTTALRALTTTTAPATSTKKLVWDNPMPHPHWTDAQLKVEQTHVVPKSNQDTLAYRGVKLVRFFFDIGSGYAFGPINEKKLLRRIIFLETVAGIPGMVAGSIRHLKSLRRIQRDMGWIHTLLEEAENERMHLLAFKQLLTKEPGILMKSTVWVSQIIAWNAFFWFYLFSPAMCHRFVGYVEEEAVHTYTGAIEAYDKGLLPSWVGKPVPEIASRYWGLQPTATMRDLLMHVRADEALHRDVNHTLSALPSDQPNPYLPNQAPKH